MKRGTNSGRFPHWHRVLFIITFIPSTWSSLFQCILFIALALFALISALCWQTLLLSLHRSDMLLSPRVVWNVECNCLHVNFPFSAIAINKSISLSRSHGVILSIRNLSTAHLMKFVTNEPCLYPAFLGWLVISAWKGSELFKLCF